jgi:hypothetical protein
MHSRLYTQGEADALLALGLHKTAGYAELAKSPLMALGKDVAMSSALGAGAGALMSEEDRLENALRGGAIGGAMGLGAHGLRRGGGALMREGASPNAMAAGKDLQAAAGLTPWFAPIAGGLTAKKKEEKQ